VRPRILYCQYTNPAAYPPLEHGARILAREGWDVVFLGIGAFGRADGLTLLPSPGVVAYRLPYRPPGRRQKAHYARYALWVLRWAFRWRPDWLYASDPLSTPIALAVSRVAGCRVVYHEHDSPDQVSGAGAGRPRALLLRARAALVRRAALCVLPSEVRAQRFRHETGRERDVLTVWNCPLREEVAPARSPHDGGALWVLCHGSITPTTLPLSVVDALPLVPERLRLRIVGYETAGRPGHTQAIRARAAALGVSDRVEIVEPVGHCSGLLDWTRRSDVGLALMPSWSENGNERMMVGASNKPFDYLASGLALVVSDLPDWRALFVERGLGRACIPEDPKSLAETLAWYLAHPAEMRAMGERGRRRVRDEWHYERAFEPVLRRLRVPRVSAGLQVLALPESRVGS
jgi:glycosyltransferase involved in cell wall biosynthesis